MVSDERPAGIVVDLGSEAAAGLATLEELTENPTTAGIPIHAVGRSHQDTKVRSLGAINYMKRPIEPSTLRDALRGLTSDEQSRRVLVVEANPENARELEALLDASDAETIVVSTAKDAIEVVRQGSVTCVITDLDLPDAPGHELIRRLSTSEELSVPSVIIYTDRDISESEEAELMRYSDAIILKGPRSSERLLDEVTLFLHRVQRESPPTRIRPPSSRARSGEPQLVGRKVMLLEDDVRSVFALTSVIEGQGAELTIARNANEALALLQNGAGDVELILMDLMLPEMDGLEATRRIRRMPGRVGKVPIIALTAKSMANDRDACLEAGANDYVSKPIEVDKLVSLMRIWLSR
jgi:CheY-like chemotaxis protein